MEVIYCKCLMHCAQGKTQVVQSSWDDINFCIFTAAAMVWHQA